VCTGLKAVRGEFAIGQCIDTQIDESTSTPAGILKLVAEGKLIIKNRQILIKIVEKN